MAPRPVGGHDAARDLLVAATRWYAESGSGEGAALATCLLVILRAEDGEAEAVPELAGIRAAARVTGDPEVEALAGNALDRLDGGGIPRREHGDGRRRG